MRVVEMTSNASTQELDQVEPFSVGSTNEQGKNDNKQRIQALQQLLEAKLQRRKAKTPTSHAEISRRAARRLEAFSRGEHFSKRLHEEQDESEITKKRVLHHDHIIRVDFWNSTITTSTITPTTIYSSVSGSESKPKISVFADKPAFLNPNKSDVENNSNTVNQSPTEHEQDYESDVLPVTKSKETVFLRKREASREIKHNPPLKRIKTRKPSSAFLHSSAKLNKIKENSKTYSKPLPQGASPVRLDSVPIVKSSKKKRRSQPSNLGLINELQAKTTTNTVEVSHRKPNISESVKKPLEKILTLEKPDKSPLVQQIFGETKAAPDNIDTPKSPSHSEIQEEIKTPLSHTLLEIDTPKPTVSKEIANEKPITPATTMKHDEGEILHSRGTDKTNKSVHENSRDITKVQTPKKELKNEILPHKPSMSTIVSKPKSSNPRIPTSVKIQPESERPQNEVETEPSVNTPRNDISELLIRKPKSKKRRHKKKKLSNRAGFEGKKTGFLND